MADMLSDNMHGQGYRHPSSLSFDRRISAGLVVEQHRRGSLEPAYQPWMPSDRFFNERDWLLHAPLLLPRG
jgi:hypothetical protein